MKPVQPRDDVARGTWPRPSIGGQAPTSVVSGEVGAAGRPPNIEPAVSGRGGRLNDVLAASARGLCVVALVVCGSVPALSAVGDVVRASQPVDGVAAASGPASVSGDGRWVAFTSRANLAGTNVGGIRQLYVREVESGRIVVASAAKGAQPANGDVDEDVVRPRHGLSVDGRYAVFSSVATNLVGPDRNGAGRDVFRKDLLTGAVTLVSRSSGGEQAATGVAGEPSLSADGNRIAFSSGAATDLLAGDDRNGALSDALVRDIRAGTTELASRLESGDAASEGVANPQISADGFTIAVEIGADVFARSMNRGVTRRVAGAARLGAISGAGQHVAISTVAALVSGDTNGLSDVYLAAPFSGDAAVLVSRAAGSAFAGNGASERPTMSADAAAIAFQTSATDIVVGDLNGAVADGVVAFAGSTLRETGRPDGTQPLGATSAPALSGNGALLAFGYSDAFPGNPFLPGDIDGAPDTFVRVRSGIDRLGPTLGSGRTEGGPAVVRVSGRVSDASGVASLTVAGRPAIVGSDGAYAAEVTRPAGLIRVEARDGAGNHSVQSVNPPAIAGPSPPGLVAAVNIRSLLVQPNGVRVGYQLDGPANVAVQLLRRVAAASGAKAGWAQVVRRLPSRREAGANQALLRSAARLPVGVYQVRVWATSSGVRQATRNFTVAIRRQAVRAAGRR